MSYIKTIWVNDQLPAINADNLNNIENGIKDNETLITALSIGETNRGTFTPTVLQEYPTSPAVNDVWYISDLTNGGYTYAAGDLVGKVANNFDKLMYTSTGYYLVQDNDTYLNIFSVNSIADMLLLDTSIYSAVNVKGYYTPNDGGGGIFNYDATQSAVNNDGTIIYGWVRQYEGNMNVKWFGAKGDGITDESAAFQAVATATGKGIPIFIPSGSYKILTQPIDSQDYFWVGDNAESEIAGNAIDLKGHIEVEIQNRRLIKKVAYDPGEFTTIQTVKKFDYIGGTPGDVVSTSNITTTATSGVTDYVWGLVSILENSADSGENVAIYAQGNRNAGTGPIWATVHETRDKTGTSSLGKAQTVGVEVGVFVNGADDGANRIGVDAVIGVGGMGGLKGYGNTAFRAGAFNGDINDGEWKYGLQSTHSTNADVICESTSVNGVHIAGANNTGIKFDGTCIAGLDTSLATISGNAIRVGANQSIALEATGAVNLKYDSANLRVAFTGSEGLYGSGNTRADFRSASNSTNGVMVEGTNNTGVLLKGTCIAGVSTALATVSGDAIVIAAGQTIALEATGAITVKYDAGSNSILFQNAGVTKHSFSMV